LAVVAALVGLPLAAHAQSAPRPRFVEGEVIVKFKNGTTTTAIRSALTTSFAGASVGRIVSARTGPVALARFPRGAATVQQMAARYSANPEVLYAEPNYIAYASPITRSTTSPASRMLRVKTGVDASGQPQFSEVPRSTVRATATYPVENPSLDQWGWYYTDANIVWASTIPSPMVAVLDTGVDNTHPDLVGKVIAGLDIVNGDGIPMDDNGHGTHVAGIIAARMNNGIGISGATNASILAIKVLDYAGNGTHFDIAEGLNRASVYAAVRVINMSFGGPDTSSTLEDAINYAVNVRGKLIVAAAGNDATTTAPYPAAYSVYATANGDPYTFLNRVLAVGAQGRDMVPSSGLPPNPRFVEYCQATYSNYGYWVNIVAPGTAIWSTTPYKKDFYGTRYGDSTDGYNSYSGTSMAAPFVAAAASRVFCLNATFTNVQVAQRLIGDGSPAFRARTGQVDIDGDGILEPGDCWDPVYADVSADRPVALADLDFAMASQRSAVKGYAYNGLALTGAAATALCGSSRSVSAPIGSNGNPTENWFDILNVPWEDQPYTININKAGYTNGQQAFQTIRVNSSSIWFETRSIAVPPVSGNSTLVTNWGRTGSTYVELDQHLLFPVRTSSLCDVGLATPGLATNSAYWCGTGTLSAAPFSRWMFDSYWSDQPFETTSSKPPLYSTVTQPYRLFVVDFNEGADLSDYTVGWPIARLWRGGFIKNTVAFGHGTGIQGGPNPADPSGTTCTLNGGSADCHIWHVGNMLSNGVLTPTNQLGDGVDAAVIPFGGSMLRVGSSTRSDSGTMTTGTTR
jgi:thermitase